jgi:hypothetical protein
MATKNMWNQEDEDEESGGKGTTVQSGVLGGNQGSGGVAAPGTQARGTQWTNLQQYLDTNKGAGNAIARDTLEGTNQEIGNTKGLIGDWAKQAGQRVTDSTLKDEWSDKIKTSSVDDLSKLDKDKFSQWKQLGTYWGNSDAEADTGYGAAKGASDQTWGKIENANTWQGQQGLAKDTYGKGGRYSSGMGVLDAFVARGDAQDKFDEFKSGNSNFQDNLTAAKTGVNTAIGQAKDTGKANYKSVMDSIAGRIQGIQGEQDARATAANEEADRLSAEAYQRALTDPSVAYDAIKMPKAGSFVTHTTSSDMATQAEIDALNSLGGFDDDVSTGGYAVGSGPKAGFDSAAFQNELQKYIVTPPAQPDMSPTSDGDFIFTPTGERYKEDGTPIAKPTEVVQTKGKFGGSSTPVGVPLGWEEAEEEEKKQKNSSGSGSSSRNKQR